jgi:hypothetical protein
MRKVIVAAQIVLILLLPLLSAELARAGSDCLEYEPAVVKLTGKAIEEKHILRPNQPVKAKGNGYVHFPFLALDKPVCVKGPEGDPYNPPEAGIRKMQLVLDEAQDRAYATMLNRKVVVTGKLWHGNNQYHRTPVLIIVESITPAD